MGLDAGSASFRMMELPRSFPKDWASRFAARAAAPLDGVGETESTGWVTSRHLLDARITEESALEGGYVHLVMRIAQRKVPSALLRAECKLEELAVMAADGKHFLKAKDRAEIRKSVQDRLLPSMPPQLKAIPFLHSLDETYLWAGATSEAQTDQLNGLLSATLGMAPQPSDPETLAMSLRNIDTRDIGGASFSPDMTDVAMAPAIGREFLTWLWFAADSQNGSLTLSDGRELGLLVEGPLTFMYEGNGAHVTTLRKGMPETSLEAKSCLLAGKKLTSAKLSMALDDEHIWSFQADADLFAFRGMKTPKGEGLDSLSRFQERMIHLADWRTMWLDLYGQFLDIRTDAAAWRKELKKLRDWVAGRPARR